MTARTLEDLRREIDSIDAELHGLLMRRGAVIEAVTAAKRGGMGGAFRPDREADMMRRLVERHRGVLPLATVEHLWREIISSCTQLQTPFRLHIAPGEQAVQVADLARYAFGFTTPLVEHGEPRDVVAAVGQSADDLGLIPMNGSPDGWWRELGRGADVMARLPFLLRPNGDAQLAALVISRPLRDVRPFDTLVLVAEGAGEVPGAETLARAEGARLLAVARDRLDTVADALGPGSFRQAGGYFDPLRTTLPPEPVP